jgi:lysophospholipase
MPAEAELAMLVGARPERLAAGPRGEAGLEIVTVAGGAGPLRLGLAAPAGRPRGSVLVLPGRAEFVEKYAETVDDLLRQGLAVAVAEWRSQGLSARDLLRPGRGHVDDFADYLDDLARVLGELDRRALPRPWLLLGHSMGGHLGLRWLREGAPGFAAAILTAPMLGIPLRGVPEPLARLIGRASVRVGAARAFAPGQRDFRLERCRFEGNPLTSCPIRYARFRAQLAARPELAVGGATWGWLDAALRSIAHTRARGYPEAIRTPLLLCAAEEERIICNRSMAELAERLPDATLLPFPAARHDLLIERDPVRARLLAALAALADRVAP